MTGVAWTAVQQDNKIIFIGNSGNTQMTNFDIYDILTNTWAIGLLPMQINNVSIISVNNIVYLAGGFVNGVLSDQFWKLEF